MRQRLREGFFLLCIALACFLFVSLGTYHANDPGWSSTGNASHIANAGGWVGAWVADIFLSLFGWVAYLFPILVMLSCWLSWSAPEEKEPTVSWEWMYKTLGWVLFTISTCALVGYYIHTKAHLPTNTGGIIGDLVGRGLAVLFNEAGSTIFFISLMLCGITLVTGLSWLGLMEKVGEAATRAWFAFNEKRKAWLLARAKLAAEKAAMKPIEEPKIQSIIPAVIKEVFETSKDIEKREPPMIQLPPAPKPVVIVRPEPVKAKKKIELDPNIRMEPGELPAFELLNPTPPANEKAFSDISFEELSSLVEQRLADFGVEVKVVAGVRLKDTQTGETRTLDATGVFIAIGHQPNTGIFQDQLAMDASGYLTLPNKNGANATQTAIPGVFAAGDVADSIYRQAITAAGTGCMAALDADKYLESIK